jgi:hypothetical protein
MVLHSYSIPLGLAPIELLVCLRSYWPHQDSSALSFQLDEYGGHILVVCQAEDDSSTDKIQVGVEGVWVIELNADRHFGHDERE